LNGKVLTYSIYGGAAYCIVGDLARQLRRPALPGCMKWRSIRKSDLS
jgi:hypothetical protein